MAGDEQVKIVVTGSRNRKNDWVVQKVLDWLASMLPVTQLSAGDAHGVDEYAHRWRKQQRRPVGGKVWKADWTRWGLRAGPIRNGEMLDGEDPDLVVAFPGTQGTADCVSQALRRGIPVLQIPEHVRMRKWTKT